jgi:HK97 gp10 family phage protein
MSSISIDRRDRLTIIKINTMGKLTARQVEFAAWTSARGLQSATSKEILRRPKGGRTYIRRDRIGRRRRHIASAPGETHANMTGRLRRSLSFRVNSREIEFGYGVTDGSAPEYAKFVEFGTNRMKARPSLRNGIKGERRNIMNNIEREIKGELR